MYLWRIGGKIEDRGEIALGNILSKGPELKWHRWSQVAWEN